MFWCLRVERPQCCCSFYTLLTYILRQLTGVWGPKLNYTEHQNRISGPCTTDLQIHSCYNFEFDWSINLLRPSPISTHASMRRVSLATWFHTSFHYCSLNVSYGTTEWTEVSKIGTWSCVKRIRGENLNTPSHRLGFTKTIQLLSSPEESYSLVKSYVKNVLYMEVTFNFTGKFKIIYTLGKLMWKWLIYRSNVWSWTLSFTFCWYLASARWESTSLNY